MAEKHYLYSLLDFLGISINAFERSIDVGQGTISKVVNDETGSRSLSRTTIRKITDKYPNISSNWLLTGEGPMLTSGQEVFDIAQKTNKPHIDDKDVRGLTDYLLAEKLKSMQDMIDEMRQWKKEIEDKLDEKDKKE